MFEFQTHYAIRRTLQLLEFCKTPVDRDVFSQFVATIYGMTATLDLNGSENSRYATGPPSRR